MDVDLEKLRELNVEFDAAKEKNKPLTSRIVQLKSEIDYIKTEIEVEDTKRIIGNVKPGCWVDVKTKENGKFIGFFHSYGERDGYETPVFIVAHEVDYLEYKDIEHIKKVSQRETTDHIKRD